MNEIWILNTRTSLPEVCENFAQMTPTTEAFDSFEKARDAMRAKIREFAFSKNSMFDGKGNITYLKNYTDDIEDEVYEDFEVLDYEKLVYITDSLRDAFEGKDLEFELPAELCGDGMLVVSSTPGEMFMHGDYEGIYNGYNPLIKTNIFSMKEEKNYYLYLDDRFGQDDATSELYIDLVKAEVK